MKIYKNLHGNLQADSYQHLKEDEGDTIAIKITTCKRYNNELGTTVKIVKRHTLKTDSSITMEEIIKDMPLYDKWDNVRCTQKAVMRQHSAVIMELDKIRVTAFKLLGGASC